MKEKNATKTLHKNIGRLWWRSYNWPTSLFSFFKILYRKYQKPLMIKLLNYQCNAIHGTVLENYHIGCLLKKTAKDIKIANTKNIVLLNKARLHTTKIMQKTILGLGVFYPTRHTHLTLFRLISPLSIATKLLDEERCQNVQYCQKLSYIKVSWNKLA